MVCNCNDFGEFIFVFHFFSWAIWYIFRWNIGLVWLSSGIHVASRAFTAIRMTPNYYSSTIIIKGTFIVRWVRVAVEFPPKEILTNLCRFRRARTPCWYRIYRKIAKVHCGTVRMAKHSFYSTTKFAFCMFSSNIPFKVKPVHTHCSRRLDFCGFWNNFHALLQSSPNR